MTYLKQVTLIDVLENLSRVTPYNELATTGSVRIAGAVFAGTTVDANFWTTTQSGSGSITQVNGEQILRTGATANASATTSSVVVARFVASSQNRLIAHVRMGDTGAANNSRRWGAFNGTDGAYFKLSGTILSACTMLNGVEAAVVSSAWNGDPTVPVLTELNLYEILYLSSAVVFLINGVAAHIVTASPLPWTATLHLPARADNFNSAGGAANVSMYLRDLVITRLGQLETQPKYFHGSAAVTTVLKYAPGVLHRIALNSVSTSTLTLYDDTSAASAAKVIAAISGTNQAGPATLEFGVVFSAGLTVKLSGSWDCTIVYE